MTDERRPPLPRIGRLRLAEIAAALSDGWEDFRAAPAFGLFFALVYVGIGNVLIAASADAFIWTLAVSLGFPLAAPFLAVGLYEVSRRREAGQALLWREVLGVIWRERTRQVPWLGAIIVIYFMFWTFLAHMIFALFMGPSALTHPPDQLSAYMTSTGFALALTELVVGGLAAFLLFSLTVVSLPMLLEREVDFVTAMLHSIAATRANLGVMLVWAGIIAGLTFVAMLPWFLGLLVVLPVLGHASWHLYRRVLYQEI